MRSIYADMVMIPVIIFTLFTPSHADVEWDLLKTYKIEGTPLDVAISKYGRWVFVLTEQGEVLIYSRDGTLDGKIPVGNSMDGSSLALEKTYCCSAAEKARRLRLSVLTSSKKSMLPAPLLEGRQMHRW